MPGLRLPSSRLVCMLGMTSLLGTYFDKCPSGLEPSEKNLLSAARNLDNIVVRLRADGRFDHQRGGADDRLVGADAPIRRAGGPGLPGPFGLGLPPVRTGSAPAVANAQGTSRAIRRWPVRCRVRRADGREPGAG